MPTSESRHVYVVAGLIALMVGGLCGAVHPVAGAACVLGVMLIAWIVSDAFRATLAFLLVLIGRPADMLPALDALKPAKLLAVSALLLFVFGRLLTANWRFSRAPQDKLMLALACAILASTLTSSDVAASMALFTDSFVKIIILYVLIRQLVETPQRTAALQFTLASICTLLGVYALYAKLTGHATVEGSRAGFVGLLGDPNDLALVLLMYVPFLFEAVLASTGVRRWLLILQLGLLISGLVSTLSRGGFLGLGTALAIACSDRGSLRVRLTLFPLGGLLLVLLAFIAGVGDRHSGGLESEGLDESAQGRLDAWRAGGRMLLRHPLFGVGFGRFADNYESYASDAVIWGKHETHNSYIKVAAETGTAGFVPFIGLVVLTFLAGFRLRRLKLQDTGLVRAARRAILPSICGFCVSAFFLSQCWSWFFFILFAQAAATAAVRLGESGA